MSAFVYYIKVCKKILTKQQKSMSDICILLNIKLYIMYSNYILYIIHTY